MPIFLRLLLRVLLRVRVLGDLAPFGVLLALEGLIVEGGAGIAGQVRATRYQGRDIVEKGIETGLESVAGGH